MESSHAMNDVTEKLVKRQSGEYDAELVLRVCLDGFGLLSMSGISCCPNLVELSLSQNQITRIEGLDKLSNLKKLDLSYNKIASIANVSHLYKLEWCDLRCNRIEDLSSANALAPLMNLKTLFMYAEDSDENNPVCAHSDYRKRFLEALPQLVTLDGSHSSLVQTVSALESRLAAIRPDPQYTRALPLQPWFEGRIDRSALRLDSNIEIEEEEDACVAAGGTGFLDALTRPGAAGGRSGGSAADALDALLDEARGMLSAESARLLKKADEIVAKQKNL